MTSSVRPSFSSNVTVVTEPFSPPSSFVQTMSEGGVTSMYRPKKSMPSPKLSPIPPVRTSISHEFSFMPIDFGTHHLWNSSGFDQASNTRQAPEHVESTRDDEPRTCGLEVVPRSFAYCCAVL